MSTSHPLSETNSAHRRPPLKYEQEVEEQEQGDDELGEGAELASPLVSRGAGGEIAGRERKSKHPGWGFGYNGTDPRVNFEPQARAMGVVVGRGGGGVLACWCAPFFVLLLYVPVIWNKSVLFIVRL